MVNAVIPPDGRDGIVVVGSWVGLDPMNNSAAAQIGHSVTLPDAIWVVVSASHPFSVF